MEEKEAWKDGYKSEVRIKGEKGNATIWETR